jgi:signal peptidase II
MEKTAAATLSTPGTARPTARHLLVFFVIGLGIALLDLWTKAAAFRALGVEVKMGNGGRPVLEPLDGSLQPGTPGRPAPKNLVVIPNWFELEANINYGAFSGWFANHTSYLALLSLAALFAIFGFLLYSLKKTGPPAWYFTIGLGLLWGGTLGNFHDRFFIGGVRDFIKWFFVWTGEPITPPRFWPRWEWTQWLFDGKPHVWPNFNIADSAICVGVGLFVLRELLLLCRRKK